MADTFRVHLLGRPVITSNVRPATRTPVDGGIVVKKLFRIAVFAGGAIVLFLGTRTDTRAYGGACVKKIESDSEFDCAGCCKNWGPVTIATYVSDSSFGPSSYYYATGSCGGVLDNSCSGSMCGSFEYLAQFQDAACCNGQGGGCGSAADCCSPLVCNTYGMCMPCKENGAICTGDSDCCSSNCDSSKGVCKTGFNWN